MSCVPLVLQVNEAYFESYTATKARTHETPRIGARHQVEMPTVLAVASSVTTRGTYTLEKWMERHSFCGYKYIYLG